MDTDKLVGWGLIISVILTLFTAFVIEPVDMVLADGLYTFAGMLLFIFGIWGGYKLLNK